MIGFQSCVRKKRVLWWYYKANGIKFIVNYSLSGLMVFEKSKITRHNLNSHTAPDSYNWDDLDRFRLIPWDISTTKKKNVFKFDGMLSGKIPINRLSTHDDDFYFGYLITDSAHPKSFGKYISPLMAKQTTTKKGEPLYTSSIIYSHGGKTFTM